MLNKLRDNARFRNRFVLAGLALCLAGTVYAGIKNSQIHQFPAPGFLYNHFVTLIEGPTTASVSKAIQFYTTSDQYLVAAGTNTRLLAGTITQYTLPLYANDLLLPFKAVIDAYTIDGVGALANQAKWVWAQPLSTVPVFLPAGTKLTWSLNLAGTNSPTVTDVSLELVTKDKAGYEQ